jgi:hypothetical protein
MKHKVQIKAPIDHIYGYIRRGHYEGILEMTEEEYEKFKNNPTNWIYENDGLLECKIVVDDFCIEDVGTIENVHYTDLAIL